MSSGCAQSSSLFNLDWDFPWNKPSFLGYPHSRKAPNSGFPINLEKTVDFPIFSHRFSHISPLFFTIHHQWITCQPSGARPSAGSFCPGRSARWASPNRRKSKSLLFNGDDYFSTSIWGWLSIYIWFYQILSIHLSIYLSVYLSIHAYCLLLISI